jgi:hypothetical protein
MSRRLVAHMGCSHIRKEKARGIGPRALRALSLKRLSCVGRAGPQDRDQKAEGLDSRFQLSPSRYRLPPALNQWVAISLHSNTKHHREKPNPVLLLMWVLGEP